MQIQSLSHQDTGLPSEASKEILLGDFPLLAAAPPLIRYNMPGLLILY